MLGIRSYYQSAFWPNVGKNSSPIFPKKQPQQLYVEHKMISNIEAIRKL